MFKKCSSAEKKGALSPATFFLSFPFPMSLQELLRIQTFYPRAFFRVSILVACWCPGIRVQSL